MRARPIIPAAWVAVPLVALALAGCGGGGDGGPSTPSISYAGAWGGTTSQGKTFQFYVEPEGIRLIAVGYDVAGTACTSNVVAFLPRETPDTAFAISGTTLSALSASATRTITIAGSFSSDSTASGTLAVDHATCNGSISVTWTATRSTAPAVDLDGTWDGSFASELVAPTDITMILSQTGASLSGTWSAANGATGTATGTISGTMGTFTLTETTPNCSGTFRGHAAVLTGTTYLMFFSFSGSDCLGNARGSGFVGRP